LLANRPKPNWPGRPISAHSGLVGLLVLARPDRSGRPIDQTDRGPRPRLPPLASARPRCPCRRLRGLRRAPATPVAAVGHRGPALTDLPRPHARFTRRLLWWLYQTPLGLGFRLAAAFPMLLRRCSPGHHRDQMRTSSRPTSWRGQVRWCRGTLVPPLPPPPPRCRPYLCELLSSLLPSSSMQFLMQLLAYAGDALLVNCSDDNLLC
jgi:hypothetical protein